MLYRDYLKSKYQNTAVKLANAEGVPCVLEYTKGKNIRNYEVYGNSVQDGTPTPESPVEIQSVGDLTKNLLSYPYNFTTRTKNGLTFTDNGDGSIKINGTATNRTGFVFRNQIIDIIDKTKAYVLSGGKDSNVYLQIDFYNGTTWKNLVDTGNDGKAIIDFTKINFDYTRVAVGLVVKANTVCDNITIRPQLELGETATEYEPYGYKIPIVNSGKNLLDIPSEYTWTAFVRKSTHIPTGQYVLSWTSSIPGGDISPVIRFKKNNKIYWLTPQGRSESFTLTQPETTIEFYAKNYDFAGSQGVTSTVNQLMLELGETATEYEPYRVPVTANIYLDEPLRKIGDYADYIDFKGQSVVRKVGVLDNTSTKPISESLVALAIPTEEPIPLPALKTFKGTNIISVDTSVQPSNIKAKYVRL